MLERCRAAGGHQTLIWAKTRLPGSQRPSNQDLANSAIQTVAGGFPHVSGTLLNDMGYFGSPTCSWCMSCTELILYFFPGSPFLNFQSFFNFCYLYHINRLFLCISGLNCVFGTAGVYLTLWFQIFLLRSMWTFLGFPWFFLCFWPSSQYFQYFAVMWWVSQNFHGILKWVSEGAMEQTRGNWFHWA